MSDAHQPGLFDHLPDAWSRGTAAAATKAKVGPAPKLASAQSAPSTPAPLPLWRDKADGPPLEAAPASVDAFTLAPPPSGQAAPPPSGQAAPPPLGQAASPPSGQAASPPSGPGPSAGLAPSPPPTREAAAPARARPAPTAPSPQPSSQAWVLGVQGPSDGQAALAITLDGRPHRLVVGPDGVKLLRGEELLGESGWAAFGAFLGHQRARMATLIGSRRVPGSLFEHPDFVGGILPHLYVNAYHGDRLSRGGLRRRVEVRASDLDTVEKLMAVEVACANPDCLHAIHPFRPRAKGNPLRLFVGFTCPLEESVACARTRGAKEAMEALVLRVEALGQVASNDVRR